MHTRIIRIIVFTAQAPNSPPRTGPLSNSPLSTQPAITMARTIKVPVYKHPLRVEVFNIQAGRV